MYGWNDWDNLQFYFQDSPYFGQGAQPEILEDDMTWELAQEIREEIEQNEHYPIPDSDSIIDANDKTDTEESNEQTALFPTELIIIGAIIVVIGLAVLFVLRKRT